MASRFPNFLFFTLFAVLQVSVSIATDTPAVPFRLCYFSLNSENEFKVMDEFTKKLNSNSSRKFEVYEFHNPDQNPNPEKSFENMVQQMSKSRTPCDGLVISGHHTGAFGGTRTRGTGKLSLNFLEKLACNPEYRGWFEGVKSLWLQGCRTIGPGKIEELNDPQFSADFHSQRVGAVLQEDHLTQSFAELNLEFSATLDQDNPLSSRYLRTFPSATVFGWTKSAPGAQFNSEYSIPYHIAHVAMLLDKQDPPTPIDNPIGETFSAESAVVLNQALEFLMRPAGKEPSCEDIAIQAWLDHGKGNKYVLSNPDLNAFKSLLSTGDSKLLEAKLNDCIFKNDKKDKNVLKALDRILQDPLSIGYSFNAIFETMLDLQQKSSRRDRKLLNKIQNKLRGSNNLREFLSRKLLSPQLGLVRKIDYYAFHRLMTGRTDERVEKLIREVAQKQLLIPSAGASYHDSQNYKETLLESLEKHKLLNTDLIRKLANSPESDALVLSYCLDYAKYDLPLYRELALTVIKAPGVTDKILSKILAYPPRSSNTAQALRDEKWLKLILESPKFGPHSYAAIAKLSAAYFEEQDYLRNIAGERLKKVIEAHKNSSRYLDMSPALSAVINTVPMLLGSKEVIEIYLKRNDLRASEMTALAEALALETGIKNKGSYLRSFAASPKADRMVITAICKTAAALGKDFPDSDVMISNIVRATKGSDIIQVPKASMETLYAATQAVFLLPITPERKSKLLHEIANQAKRIAPWSNASSMSGSLQRAFRDGFEKSAEPIPDSKDLLISVMPY